MKKLLIVLLIFTLALGLAGCGAETPVDKPSEPVVEASNQLQEIKDEAIKMTEMYVLGNLPQEAAIVTLEGLYKRAKDFDTENPNSSADLLANQIYITQYSIQIDLLPSEVNEYLNTLKDLEI